MNLERVLRLFVTILFLSNINKLCCTQKYATKKDAGTQIIISILSCNFEAYELPVWKNIPMLMKPKTG